jgi:CHAT domain-containing protein
MLHGDGRFEIRDEDVLIGSKQCQWMPLLERLSSGDYGLIHYSGHSGFEGEDSGWGLKNDRITTDLLTSALQGAPPVLVFSSSCESAAAGELRTATYENQTYDLPSAFLRAGVEAYVGTLWKIDSASARSFVERFYGSLLKGTYTLGQCLREAKRAVSLQRYWMDRLAFILYGDPDAMPGQLFRAMQKKEN